LEASSIVRLALGPVGFDCNDSEQGMDAVSSHLWVKSVSVSLD
jgi:hypothetical protein